MYCRYLPLPHPPKQVPREHPYGTPRGPPSNLSYPTYPSLSFPLLPYSTLSYHSLVFPTLRFPTLTYPILARPIISSNTPSNRVYCTLSYHLDSMLYPFL